MIPRARWILNPHLIIWFGAGRGEKGRSKVSESPGTNSTSRRVPNSIHQHFFPPRPKSLWVSVGEIPNKAHFDPARAGPPHVPAPWGQTQGSVPPGQCTCQHLPPFCNSISFFACSKMLLMASSEPVSGVLIRGVMLPDQRGRKTVLSPVLVLQAPLVCQEVFTAPHVQLFLGMLDLRQMSLLISR